MKKEDSQKKEDNTKRIKKKIAILTPTFSEFSGIDRVVEGEAEEYYKKGYDVTIFAFQASMKPKHAKLEIIGMPKNPTLERIYRLFFFLDRKKVNSLVERMKDFNIIVSHFYPMNLIAMDAKKKYGTKYQYYDAGVGGPELFHTLSEKVYIIIFKIFTDMTAKHADEAISISGYLARELEKDTGLKSKVVYVEIDKSRFKKGLDGSSIREKYKIGKEDPVLLYIGRISPHKGIHMLIESFKQVKNFFPKTKLIIVGKPTFPSYSKKLKTLAAGDKNIIFTGFVPDKDTPLYYAACNIYTTATMWEGFDMPAVEAQECGKPVVAFDICAHPEVVKNGILVPPKDTKAFVDAVVRLLSKKIRVE